MIRILAVGKKHEAWVLEGIERYEKRLKAPWNVSWELLPHSRFEADRARQDESESLLRRLSPDDFVILLDERGTSYDSPAFSSLINDTFMNGKKVVLRLLQSCEGMLFKVV
jgi:23S rRNA (pseudouridine1915-N3)-methyltransferase